MLKTGEGGRLSYAEIKELETDGNFRGSGLLEENALESVHGAGAPATIYWASTIESAGR